MGLASVKLTKEKTMKTIPSDIAAYYHSMTLQGVRVEVYIKDGQVHVMSGYSDENATMVGHSHVIKNTK